MEETPTRGIRSKGRQQFTFIEALQFQTGIDDIEEIRYVMMDRGEWRKLSTFVRTSARRK